MSNSIHYELAATGFFALLFFIDLLKRQLPSKRTGAFQFMLCVMMLASFFKVDSDLSRYYGESSMINAIMQAITLYCETLCFFAFYAYIQAFTHSLWKKKIQFRVDITIFAIVSVLVLSTPWTGFCFRIDKNGDIHRTMFFAALGVLILLLIVHSAIILWKSRREYTVYRMLLFAILMTGFLISILVKVFYTTHFGIFSLYIVFIMYAFYLSLQSPDFYVDNATGAFNRNGFLEVFRERISYQKETACFLVRVRNFSSMNQMYGEDVLQEVQIKIRNILEETADGGTVYHIGSSTFAVVFDAEQDVKDMYERTKASLPVVWNVNDEMVNHEYSYYTVCYPADGEDVEELIQRIHYARSDHENHHKPGELISLRHDTVAASEYKKEVAHLIEEAIMDNSLELNFQPIYSFEKEKITSLEVLSRLKDKDKKYINPEFFIHVAEESHTIIPLGEQIFRKACLFASQNCIFELGIEDININLSPAQCRYEGLTENLVNIAKEYGIPMEKIHLEITESEFVDKEAVSRTLLRLKKTGAKVALDDFGTGSSMLSNILELPVDFVKIDKSLVWSFAEGKNQFLNDLMPLIRAEGKKIIAEGIETEEHIEIIKKLQGDFLQGYYFSKPLPEDQFIKYLKRFNKQRP